MEGQTPSFTCGYLADYGKRQAQLGSPCSPTPQSTHGDQQFKTVAVGPPPLWPLCFPTPLPQAHLTSTLENMSVCFGLAIHRNLKTQGAHRGSRALFKNALCNSCHL